VGRPSNTAERRRQIVAALLAVMSKEGYGHATITAIATEAKLAPGLVHYHFENKLEILVALVEDLVARLDERAAALLAAAGDGPRARLYAIVDAHVALGPGADARAVAAWVVIGAEAVRLSEVRVIYTRAVRAWLEQLEELVRAVLRVESRRTHHAKRIAAAILSAIEGAFMLSAASPRTLPQGFAAPMLRRMADGLIDAEERATKD
jgi:TetR/AcrR family transcriptional repressor of bet genes